MIWLDIKLLGPPAFLYYNSGGVSLFSDSWPLFGWWASHFCPAGIIVFCLHACSLCLSLEMETFIRIWVELFLCSLGFPGKWRNPLISGLGRFSSFLNSFSQSSHEILIIYASILCNHYTNCVKLISKKEDSLYSRKICQIAFCIIDVVFWMWNLITVSNWFNALDISVWY